MMSEKGMDGRWDFIVWIVWFAVNVFENIVFHAQAFEQLFRVWIPSFHVVAPLFYVV